MGFIYKNVNSGQEVYSDERRNDLARAARWEESEGKRPKAPEQPVTVPEGEPTDKWSEKELRAYAAERNLELGDAKGKKAVFAAVQAERAAGKSGHSTAVDEAALGGSPEHDE